MNEQAIQFIARISILLILSAYIFKFIKHQKTLKRKWTGKIYHYSGMEFISNKFFPKRLDTLPTGLIWFCGLYFAAFAITAQRYENKINQLENKYNVFTTQTAAKVSFDNRRLLLILKSQIPYKPDFLSPGSVIDSFLYPVLTDHFFITFENPDGSVFSNLAELNYVILYQWKHSLQNAYLSMAPLPGINFNKANLREANLSKTNLQKADLQQANLQGTILEEANLTEAFIVEANLTRINLVRANLNEAFIVKSVLEDANLQSANLTGSNLWRSDLRRADLKKANLEGAFLLDASLEKADLEFANLRGAHLIGVNFEGTYLKNANLQEANLKKCKNLMAEKLIIASNLFKIKECPPEVLDGIKKYGCEEMLNKKPKEWSENFQKYRNKLLNQWLGARTL